MLRDDGRRSDPTSKSRNMANGIYTSLNSERREVRLLILEPGQFDAPLSGSLKVSSLDDKPFFNALSYVWGPELPMFSIMVAGFRVALRSNLESFLRHIRSTTEPLTLWADAICINQESITEKQTQIPLMGAVYTQATACWVWLGLETKQIRIAIETLQALTEGKHIYETSAYDLLTDPGKLDLARQYHSTRTDLYSSINVAMTQEISQIAASARLLAQDDTYLQEKGFPTSEQLANISVENGPHFASQVLQSKDMKPEVMQILHSMFRGYYLLLEEFAKICEAEEILAKHTWFGGNTFACGSSSFSSVSSDWCRNPYWTRVWTLQEICLAQVVKLHTSHLRVDFSEISGVRRHLLEHQNCCYDAALSRTTPAEADENHRKAIIELAYLMRPLTMIVDLRDDVERKRVSLKVAESIGGRNCEDYRDYIYGIMGVVSELQIPVDYHQTVEVVYSLAAAAFIQSSRELEILSVACSRPTRNSLPSWVPDWALNIVNARWLNTSLYSASCGSQADVAFPSQTSITIMGTYVDKISDVCPQSFQEAALSRSNAEEWESFAGVRGHAVEVDSVENDSFWRLLLLDSSPAPGTCTERAKPEDKLEVAMCWSDLRSGRVFSEWRQEVEALMGDLLEKHQHKRLFKTESGHLGIAHQSIEVDDEVWVLLGAKVPFVIRPQTDRGLAKVLVCEAYLHGFMDGEALNREGSAGNELKACVLG